MPVEPITHLEKSIAGTVEPVTHLEKVIDQYGGGGGGGGGSVTPASIVTATGQMTPEQAAQTRGNLGAQTPFMTANISIATTDWDNGSCTKTVTGMTVDSLVFVKYSDTETEFTEAQSANSMTFTAATTPSEAVTVDIAWFKEASA